MEQSVLISRRVTGARYLGRHLGTDARPRAPEVATAHPGFRGEAPSHCLEMDLSADQRSISPLPRPPPGLPATDAIKR